MKNQMLVINLFIYYLLFNLISAPVVFGGIYLLNVFDIQMEGFKKLIGIGIFIIWVGSLIFMTFTSARASSYDGETFEEAIKSAWLEYRVILGLAIPFISPKFDNEK